MASMLTFFKKNPSSNFFATEEAKLKEPITEDMDYSRHNLNIFSLPSLCSILSIKSKYMLRKHNWWKSYEIYHVASMAGSA